MEMSQCASNQQSAKNNKLKALFEEGQFLCNPLLMELPDGDAWIR